VATVDIRYDGVSIIDDVELKQSSFTSKADGNVGQALIRVRDTQHAYAPGYFKQGKTLELFVDGSRSWDGWVFVVRRGWQFDVDDTTNPVATPRYWTLMGLDVASCRSDPEIDSYLTRVEDTLFEADQDAKSYHLRREENQEVGLMVRFRMRYLTWEQMEPPACAAEIHARMLAYFRAYERAYTVKYDGILGEILDPVYSGYIGVGVENLEIAWRLIQALKAPSPPPRNNNFLNA